MNVTLKDLLDAGVHFGHQRKRWNPRSREFVYGHLHGVSVIDLEKTHACLEKAGKFLEDLVAEGGNVLLVGTKRQAQELVREAGQATGMPFCANRWLGGALTNFQTIKGSLAKYKKYKAMDEDGSLGKMHKKEEAAVRREMARMHRNFEGMLSLEKLPAAMFVVDIKNEEIAVAEARRLSIPLVGLVDTNADPTLLDYPIPGNDDAVKSLRIIVDTIVEFIQAGLSQRESRNASKAISAAARERIEESSDFENVGGGEVTIEGEALGSEPRKEAPVAAVSAEPEKSEAPAKPADPAKAEESAKSDAPAEPDEPAPSEEPAEPAKADKPAKSASEGGSEKASGESKQ